MNQKLNFFTALVLAAGALAVSATGCELIASVDRSKIPGAGGGGAGTGGTGGTTVTSSTGTGGTTGGGGSGGTTTSSSSSSTSSSSTTTTAPPTCTTAGGTTCVDVAMCPAAAECKHAVCNATSNCCEEANDDNGVAAATQTDGDCKTAVCDGNGGKASVNEPGDVPANANDCSVGACNAGTAVQNPKMQGTACATGGGAFCDGAGNCVECNTDANCAGNTLGHTACSSSHACVAPTCTDNKQDGAESDVDCGGIAGGSGCSTCADGKHCAQNTDCGASSICKLGVCTAASCTDGVKDGAETDVDCGGAACRGQGKTCALTKTCAVNADCGSLFCNPTTLKCAAPTCSDGFPNGAESDTDCGAACAGQLCVNGKLCNGGTDCVSGVCNSGICGTLGLGVACTTGANCGSGNCVDNVCCSASSCGSCQACSAVLKQDALANGACGNVKDGTDPHTSCPAQAASTCGNVGSCTAGACTKFAAGTACGTTASCSGSSFTPAQTCPGGGAACSTVSAAACLNSLICADATSCKTSCATDTDCTGGLFCNASHACSAPLANGATCANNSQCQSGNCNGTTCAAACTDNAGCTSGMCYAGACVATSINGCSIGTATDMTGQANVAITFANGNFSYAPKCLKVTAGTVVTFNGNFASHPLLGGQDVSGTGVPATSGPFIPVTNTGTTTPFTMSSAGTFPYYCTAHVNLGMEGTIFVVP